MPKAHINGIDMYYEVHGKGFPLIYIHGGMGGLGTGLMEPPTWRDRFAKHFTVITYDRRAAGRSGYPEDGYTMENLAKDARELLRYLGHNRAHVLGTSGGGAPALAFGLEYPEVTASLVVTDSAPWLSQDKELKAKLRKRIRLLQEKGPEAAYEARRTAGTVGLNVYSGRAPQTEEERRTIEENLARTRAYLQQIPPAERIAKYAGELRNYSAYIDWDATPRLRQLKPPTLLVWGTNDTVFPEAGNRNMLKLIPHVEYKAFKGAEHGVLLHHPEGLDIILSFLLRHTP